MNINAFKYCLRQTAVSLSRNKWLALVSAGMIAVSLAILGSFLLMAVNTGQMMQNIQSNLEIVVILERDADTEAIGGRLKEMDGVVHLAFVSRHDGLEQFGRALGDDALLQELQGENNPLPEIFRVRARDAELVPALAGRIELLSGVESVEYGRELVGTLTRITAWVNRASMGVSAMLAVGAVFLIVTAIRLSVVLRREEIEIMKYLGAGNWFVRLPFLLEGLLIGWVGTLFSIAVLGAAYSRVAAYLAQNSLVFFLQPVTDMARLIPIFAGLLLLGTLMGGLGSVLSIRKFLKV